MTQVTKNSVTKNESIISERLRNTLREHIRGSDDRNDWSFWDDDVEGPRPITEYPTDDYDTDDESEAPLELLTNPVSQDEWSDLVADTDYEINNVSHIIRKKDSKYIPKVKIWKGNDYYQISLNRKLYYFHRVLAIQYIPNPDNLKEVDHVDRNKLNNKLTNLRWVSHGSNSVNRSSHNGYKYQWHDNLPEDAEAFTRYNTHEIENLFKTLTNEFFKAVIINNQIKYRKLVICEQGKYRHIKFIDLEGNRISIYLSML
jgi:hypothetical protein